eukprot:1398795-Pleurochrysis_carterae.AAC.1
MHAPFFSPGPRDHRRAMHLCRGPVGAWPLQTTTWHFPGFHRLAHVKEKLASAAVLLRSRSKADAI